MNRTQTEMCVSDSLQSHNKNDLFFRTIMTGLRFNSWMGKELRYNLQVFSQVNVTKVSIAIPQGHLPSFV